MIAEILSIGTELLMGQIANTDAQYISRRLGELGINIYRHSTVGDNPERVREALAESISRSDIVITTGGLGPTEDDLTKEMVAEHFGLEMYLHQPSLDALTERLTRMGREMTPNNKKQAMMPVGARVMPNLCGTAPGAIVEGNGKAVAILPGPPREMQDMFERQLVPYLEGRAGVRIDSRFLHVCGIGESKLETILIDLFHSENPTLALYCSAGEVTARLSARVADGEDSAKLLDPLENEIRARAGRAVYGEGRNLTLAAAVVNALIEKNITIACAESLTGGMLASRIVDVPGASAILNEAYVTYSNEAKMRLLGVSEDTLRNYGAVSAQCAKEMAEGARRAAGADCAISTTGIAGPDGGTPEKPVGLVYVGIATPDGCEAVELHLRGDRRWVRELTCVNAFNELRLRMNL